MDTIRRARVDQLTPAERAIYDATIAVEALPADTRLTNAVVMLSQARANVADYVDGVQPAAVVEAPKVEVAVTIERGTDGLFSAITAPDAHGQAVGISAGPLDGALEFAREQLTAAPFSHAPVTIAAPAVLMSPANPTGWKLEDLLAALQGEVRCKCAKIDQDARPPARQVLRNNQQIIGLLAQAEALQRSSHDVLDAMGPNEGPLGKPRIGAGCKG